MLGCEGLNCQRSRGSRSAGAPPRAGWRCGPNCSGWVRVIAFGTSSAVPVRDSLSSVGDPGFRCFFPGARRCGREFVPESRRSGGGRRLRSVFSASKGRVGLDQAEKRRFIAPFASEFWGFVENFPTWPEVGLGICTRTTLTPAPRLHASEGRERCIFGAIPMEVASPLRRSESRGAPS